MDEFILMRNQSGKQNHWHAFLTIPIDKFTKLINQLYEMASNLSKRSGNYKYRMEAFLRKRYAVNDV
ncbi:hypothetical protein MKY19_28140 [Paenibacillus sp. FSL R5-0744]|uniref:hypothetical protein n=1 Tax=Paenibacillus sp. FSL R5-0744 TaxID=2921656 RepID=UPI0030DCD392